MFRVRAVLLVGTTNDCEGKTRIHKILKPMRPPKTLNFKIVGVEAGDQI